MYVRVILIIIFFASCRFPYDAQDVTYEKANLEIDEMPHTKNSLEWWYFTGHLKDTLKNKKLGVEYVVFHFNPTNIKGGWMINMAISDPDNNKFYHDHELFPKKKHEFEFLPLNFSWEKRKLNASLVGQKGEYLISAKMRNYNISYQLKTKAIEGVVMQDGIGYETYGDYAKAGYYSYPKLASSGNVIIESDTFQVSGNLWYDRQWNCSGVFKKNIAWDWFSIHFEESDSELMIYRLFRLDDEEQIFGGTYTDKNGNSTFLENDQIRLTELEYWTSEESKAIYPVKWNLIIPAINLNATVQSLFPKQELALGLKLWPKYYYWEGMSEVNGFINNKAVNGKGYVEMTNRFRIKK